MRDSQRILLVEDSEEIQRVNSRMLARRGYRVESALTLAEARACLRAAVPDLVVLDILLPDGDGLDFCAELRAMREGLPILFLTARDKASDIVKGLEGGGDDYLTKPYDYDVFVARVEALLRRAAHAHTHAQAITRGPLRLDILAGRAYLGNVDVLLKPKEFALLLTLVRHEGEVLSAETLFERVWAQESNDDIRTVRAHISKLRAKLGIGKESALAIEALWGRGYCFILKGDEKD